MARLFSNAPRRPWQDAEACMRQKEGRTWYHKLERFDREEDGLSWHRLREVLEETYQALPSETQEDVLKRCRNQAVPELADGCLFELILYRLLLTLGFDVEWEPYLPTGQTPDFLAHGQGKSFYVEALVAGADEFDLNSNEQKVVTDLNEHLTFRSFGLWFVTDGDLKRTLGPKHLRKHMIPKLQAFLGVQSERGFSGGHQVRRNAMDGIPGYGLRP